MNTEDKGRRALASYLRRTQQRAFVDGVPTEAAMDLSTAKSLADLFCQEPFDRLEYDEHEIDADFWLWIYNAKGDPVLIKCKVWLLVLYEVQSGAIVSWKIVLNSFNSLDVAQCHAYSLRPWEPRPLVAPDMTYVPTACLPSALDWGGNVQTGRSVCIDNHRAHLTKLQLETWARHHHGILNLGRPAVPETRASIERFFFTFEQAALKLLPGGFRPAKELGEEKTPTSDWNAKDHPLHLQALEDLMDVMSTSFNVTGQGRIQDRAPTDVLVAYRNSRQHWPAAPRSEYNTKAMTTVVISKKFAGSEKKKKVVHIYYEGVRYRHPHLDNRYNLLRKDVNILVDLEDLRKIQVVNKDLSLNLTLEAERPWSRSRHDLTQRKRIRALSRGRQLSLIGVDDAVRAYVAYTLNRVGTNQHINAQAAQLLHQFVGRPGEPTDAAAIAVTPPKRPIPASVPRADAVAFSKIRNFK